MALDQAPQAVANPFRAFADNFRANIDNHCIEILRRRYLHNAAPHETDADNTHFADPRRHREFS
jgi:hypothetical protein